MKFTTKFGLGEIVIRESHKNGQMVQERMMEVIGIVIQPTNTTEGAAYFAEYLCEDTTNGHRQIYAEAMLVGDPDFNQDTGKYEAEILDTNRSSNK